MFAICYTPFTYLLNLTLTLTLTPKPIFEENVESSLVEIEIDIRYSSLIY